MDLWSVLLLVLANLFWAGNYVLGKYVVADVSPFLMTLIRWAFSLLIFIPLAWRERPDWQKVKKNGWPLLFMALTGVAGYAVVLYMALLYTGPVEASLINAANPAVIVLFSFFLLRERINGLQLIGLLASLFGVIVIISRGSWEILLHLQLNAGDALMLLDLVIWALYSIVGKKVYREVPVMTATAVTSLAACVLLLPFAFLAPRFHATPLAIGGLLYMALFASFGAFASWNLALTRVEANRAAVYLNLIPVFTCAISFALGEMINRMEILGALFVLGGVYLMSRRPRSIPQAKNTPLPGK